MPIIQSLAQLERNYGKEESEIIRDSNIIALTYILPLIDRDFSCALWQSAMECPVVFPEGVGVCPWMVPGGADIARDFGVCLNETFLE